MLMFEDLSFEELNSASSDSIVLKIKMFQSIKDTLEIRK